jgi:hypothetical protein
MSESFPRNPYKTSEQHAADIKRLLGLRDFPARTDEEKLTTLRSKARKSALDAIDTTTNPRKKREIKKGVVLEVVERNLVSENLLQEYPLVYIGSGTDVEYPLALGSRRIVLVDPIFTLTEACDDVLQRVKAVAGCTPHKKEGGHYEFPFDFGSGVETASLTLVAVPFSNDNEDVGYKLPEKVGVILLFAPQGSGNRLEVGEHMTDSLVSGGVIISEHHVHTKTGTRIDLGA